MFPERLEEQNRGLNREEEGKGGEERNMGGNSNTKDQLRVIWNLTQKHLTIYT